MQSLSLSGRGFRGASVKVSKSRQQKHTGAECIAVTAVPAQVAVGGAAGGEEEPMGPATATPAPVAADGSGGGGVGGLRGRPTVCRPRRLRARRAVRRAPLRAAPSTLRRYLSPSCVRLGPAEQALLGHAGPSKKRTCFRGRPTVLLAESGGLPALSAAGGVEEGSRRPQRRCWPSNRAHARELTRTRKLGPCWPGGAAIQDSAATRAAAVSVASLGPLPAAASAPIMSRTRSYLFSRIVAARLTAGKEGTVVVDVGKKLPDPLRP